MLENPSFDPAQFDFLKGISKHGNVLLFLYRIVTFANNKMHKTKG